MAEHANGLSVQWVFGFSKDVVGGVHNLTKNGRNALFCISAHYGIIYDYEYRTQTVLQGHCNHITCCAVSRDKRWIVTADSGDDSILVIWDSLSGAPVKTLFSPHSHGVCSVDISDDALFVSTLSVASPGEKQEIAVWAWTKESDTPLLREYLQPADRHHEIKFNPVKQSEISTTGTKTVCFWDWEEFRLEGYTGKVSKTDFGHYSGKFTSTIFFADSGSALTATDEGYVVVWGSQFSTVLLDDPNDRNMKMASKVIRLVECSINSMSTINEYLAIACSDGAVRYYDFSLRLEAWFEDLAAGPVTSLSFSTQSCPYPEGEGGGPGMHFWVPDFMVGTAEAFIVGVESCVYDEVNPDDRRGTLLVQGVADHISDMCCHPFKTQLAISCSNGTLQVWDYDMKLLMNLREFNARTSGTKTITTSTAAKIARAADRLFLRPQCVAFDPTGSFIAVGFTTGEIRFLYSDSFEDLSSHTPSGEPILHLKFSPSGKYMAGYDSSSHVILFQRTEQNTFQGEEDDDDGSHNAGNSQDVYTYIGRALSHSGAVTDIEFGTRESGEVLVSVGEDRKCVEYNLEKSSVRTGVKIAESGTIRIELTARPTAVVWHPHIGEDIEDRFIVANDEFKLKEFNADSKQCRRTSLAPTFGNPPNKLITLPAIDGGNNRYVYSTAERIVGVGCIPLTGNPTEVMGIVAHPGRISCICVSHDGKFMFTGGGSDLTAGMFAIDGTALTPDVSGKDLVPYLELLDGGNGGELHNDIIDYFYLCQLRNQGENAMDVRDVSGTIPVEEIASLVRAVGYYPTEEEIENMCNEIRYKNFMVTGVTRESITLNEVIKLYINHRPVNALNSSDIDAAFEIIKQRISGSAIGDISWKDLKSLLMSEGEAIAPREMEEYLATLMGEKKLEDDDSPTEFNSSSFASLILGFEDMNSGDLA